LPAYIKEYTSLHAEPRKAGEPVERCPMFLAFEGVALEKADAATKEILANNHLPPPEAVV